MDKYQDIAEGLRVYNETDGTFRMSIDEDIILKALNYYFDAENIEYVIEVDKTYLEGFDDEMLSSPLQVDVTPFKRWR